jgi:hypothetical protein
MGNVIGNLSISKTNNADLVTLSRNGHRTTNLYLNTGVFAIGTNQSLTMGDGTRSASNANAIYGKGFSSYNGTLATGPAGGTIVATGYTDIYGESDFEIWQLEATNNETPNGIKFRGNNPTIKNYLKILSEGFISDAPRYAEGSMLIYANGGEFNRNVEWGNDKGTLVPGYPWHVLVEADTRLYLNGNPVTPATLAIAGDLIIGTSIGRGRVWMNNPLENNPLTKPLEIGGSLIIGDHASAVNSHLYLSPQTGGDLILEGNFTRRNGSFFIDNNRAVFFRGTQNATISTPGVTITPGVPSQFFSFAGIEKTGTSPVPQITLNCPVGIEEEITFTNGIINSTTNNLLRVELNGSAAGGNINSFVNGPMRKITNNSGGNASADFRFRIGKLSPQIYRPAEVADLQHNGSTDYTAEFFHDGAIDFQTDPSSFIDAKLLSVWENNHWIIDKNGNGGARVGLPYSFGRDAWFPIPNPFNVNVAVARYNDGVDSWELANLNGNFNMTPPDYIEARFETDNQGLMIYSQRISTFSPFTIGWGYNNILPLQLLTFTATQQNANGLLQWTLADATDLQRFEVEYSTDGQRFGRIGTVMPNGGISFSYLHRNLAAGMHYYRLRMVEKDGQVSFSKTEVIQSGKQQTYITGLRQNPVAGGQAMVDVYSATPQQAEAVVLDATGRLLLQQKVQLMAGANQVNLSVLPLPSGMYRLLFRTKDGVEKVMPMMK